MAILLKHSFCDADIEERLDGHSEGDFKEEEIIDDAGEIPK